MFKRKKGHSASLLDLQDAHDAVWCKTLNVNRNVFYTEVHAGLRAGGPPASSSGGVEKLANRFEAKFEASLLTFQHHECLVKMNESHLHVFTTVTSFHCSRFTR